LKIWPQYYSGAASPLGRLNQPTLFIPIPYSQNVKRLTSPLQDGLFRMVQAYRVSPAYPSRYMSQLVIKGDTYQPV